MKKGKYVHFIPLTENETVIFNGLNRQFIIISNASIPYYGMILDNPEKFLTSHSKIIGELENCGILVEDELDERIVLIRQRAGFINQKIYKATILPTFDCNYRCWYCIQHRENQSDNIDLENIDIIIAHIKNDLIDNRIEELILSWFGGEPLMRADIIEYVSKDLLDFCGLRNIEFVGGITTNGALLTEKIVNMLDKYKINIYQITLDGPSRIHDLIKKENSRSAFATVMNNIRNLIVSNRKAIVKLRINYTPSTLKYLEIVEEICQYIPEELRSQIQIDPHVVWQIGDSKIDIKDLRTFMELFSKNGFYLSTEHVFAMCYVEKTHYNMFFYNGGVDKCDQRPMDKLRGKLNMNVEIIWNDAPIFQNFDVLSEDSVCYDCSYYPICFNGCPIVRDDSLKKHGKIICGHVDGFLKLNHWIKDYVWRTVLNSVNLRK